MELLILLKGFCAGFFYTFLSIPIMLRMGQSVIKEGVMKGFIAVLGDLVVQVIWATLAMLILYFSYKGLSPDNKTFSLIGSIILFIMAIKVYRSHKKYTQEESSSAVFRSVFLLALGFPMRILGYTAIFLALDIHTHMPGIWESSLPIIGVCLGTALFWVIFTFSVHHTKKAISPKTFQNFNRFAAFVLIAFSIIGLLQLYFW